MQAMAAIDKRALTIEDARFITLTYPTVWEHYTPQDVKRHLDNFGKALKRKYPKGAGYWRLEFQQRGAPHFHILLVNVPWVDGTWLSETWYRIVGSGNPKHLKAGTEVRKCRNWRHASYYIAKYMAKSEQSVAPVDVAAQWAWPGRFWGVINQEYLPNDAIEMVLENRLFIRFKRVWLKWMRKKGYNPLSQRYQGFHAFLDWMTALRLIEVLE